MPVTAKLSRRFYEQFGDELANELVDWLNAVDATYRSDLREINELNFSRFDSRLEQRFAQQDAKFEQRFADVRLEIARTKVELVRWMFALWTGQLLALGGFVLAVLRLR
jgi:hypothetical protein